MFLGFCVVRPNIARDGRSMVFTPGIFTTFFVVIHHFAAVAIISDILSGSAEYLLYTSAFCGNTIKFGLRTGGVLSIGSNIHANPAKNNALIVRGKIIRVFIVGIKSKTFGFPAFNRNTENIEVAETVGCKGNRLAVVRPDRHKIVRFMQRQRNSTSAGNRHFPKIAFVGENNGFSVGGNAWVAEPFGRILSKGM